VKARLQAIASPASPLHARHPHAKMSKAESSKAAASNGVKPNPNAAGGANYELPW